MVLGLMVTTVLDVSIELGIWSVKKVGNGLYYLMYGDTEEKKEKELKEEMQDLKNEIQNLKEVIEKKEN
jgi:hypothetical protein